MNTKHITVVLFLSAMLSTREGRAELRNPPAPVTGGGGSGSSLVLGTAGPGVSNAAAAAANNKAADDGILAWLAGQLTIYEQGAATTFLSASKADSGLVHVLGVNNVMETVARTLAARAGDTWNIADHGADGTAVNDSMALTNGLAYAQLRGALGTHIDMPAGNWLFNVTNTSFVFVSYLTLEGAGEDDTRITWNDTTANAPLFGSACSNPQTNVTLRNFSVYGTWSLSTGGTGTGTGGGVGYGGGQNPYSVYCVNHLTADHLASWYSHGYGFSFRAGTAFRGTNLKTEYSRADGVNIEDMTEWSLDHFLVEHNGDDCISGHSDIYDQWTVRRNISITNGRCFDAGAIDIAGARSAQITGNILDSYHGNAITIGGAGPGPGATEGLNAAEVVDVSNNMITNCIARDGMDAGIAGPYPGGCNAIILEAPQPRAGSYNGIPGEQAGTVAGGTVTNVHNGIIDPYPEILSNSQASTVAVADNMTINVANNIIARTFPAVDGTDPRFKTFSDLKQGCIQLSNGCFDKPLPESQFQGVAFLMQYGRAQNVQFNDNNVAGMGTGFYTQGSGLYAMWTFRGNTFYDMAGDCFDIEGTATATYDIEDNTCNADPFNKNGSRGGVGNWNNPALSGIYVIDPNAGGIYKNNKVWNVGYDYFFNAPSGTAHWQVSDNEDYADPSTIDAFSNQNGGVGYVHSAGTRIVQISAFPGASDYNSIVNAPLDMAATMPTSGFFKPGDYVRSTAPGFGMGTGWHRLTLSNGGGVYGYVPSTNYALGIDWLADNYTLPMPALVQSTTLQNADSSTSATPTFPNAVSAADTVVVALVGGNGGGTFNPAMPAGCTVLDGPGLGGYNSSPGQYYRMWACTSATALTISGLNDGALVTALEISNYAGADLFSGALTQAGSPSFAMSIPVNGAGNNIRYGMVEWDNGVQSWSTSPGSVTATGSTGSNTYHNGIWYSLPSSLAAGSTFTAQTGAAVQNPIYLQIDIW